MMDWIILAAVVAAGAAAIVVGLYFNAARSTHPDDWTASDDFETHLINTTKGTGRWDR